MYLSLSSAWRTGDVLVAVILLSLGLFFYFSELLYTLVPPLLSFFLPLFGFPFLLVDEVLVSLFLAIDMVG